MSSPAVVSFVAPSGTGKTRFIEALLGELKERGLRVLVVKHDVHGFEMDRRGKDTWRFRQAGADRVLIANAQKMALLADTDGDQPLSTLVARHAGGVDLVITEGYRQSGTPKILVARAEAPSAFDPGAPWVGLAVAAVTDHELSLSPDLPQLPLNDPGPCADFLVSRFVAGESQRRALTGVVLAGGHSQRMGEDKAQLAWQGAPLLPSLVERLAGTCPGGVIVVRRGPEQQLPQLPGGTRVVEDLLPQHAALGGLYTGLVLAETPWVFLAACDLPLLSPELVDWLAARPGRADAIVPVQGGVPQPLHAIYGHRCLAAIKESLLSGEFRMDGWLGSVRVERPSEADWACVDSQGLSFFNANTPQELERAWKLAGASGSGAS